MRFVSPLLKHALYPALHHSGVFNRIKPPGSFAVVNYHGLFPSDHSNADLFLDGNLVLAQAFWKQLRYLKTHYEIVHPDNFREVVEKGESLPPRAVLLTCDDGLLNTLTDMLPVLQSENVPCLFFVTGASCTNNPGMLWYEELYQLMRIRLLEPELELRAKLQAESRIAENFQARWWKTIQSASRLDANARADWMDRVRSYRSTNNFQSEKRWRLLTISELKQLADSGMTIGAHTLTHPILSLCSEGEARREICESKKILEQAIGRRVWAFAYPYGNRATIGQRELHLARESGFSCAFLNVEHWNGESNWFTVPRIHVSLRTTLPEFAAHLSGVHLRLQRAVGS
jgi:peptidoglycan/xylan/chitin deacetylase (PgdA/CDA1 family)